MAEIIFNPNSLKCLEKIGVKYNDSEGKCRVIDANVIFVSDNNITLSSIEKNLKLEPPQIISLKYVLDNTLCDADTILDSVKIANGLTYLIIDYPKKVTQINRRRYYRISLKRACVLIATDENGNSKCFMSRLVDISIGGLLIHKLESMFSDKYVKIEPSAYKYFNIVLFLDIDVVLKLSARCIRQEKDKVSYRYAFEFTNVKNDDIETISKYVTQEQIKQRKQQKQHYEPNI